MKLTEPERDIILAALRLWQGSYLHDPELLDIATNGFQHEPLADANIHRLCQKLNQ